MSSVRDSRQRAAARAKLEREMAARQAAAHRKRIMQARIGAGVAGVLVLGVIAWIIVATAGGSGSPTTPAGPTAATCSWIPAEDAQPTTSPSASASATAKATKAPPAMPATSQPNKGFQVVTFTTNLGVVKVEMDLSKTPCTAASIASLAKQKYFDGTSCHRLVDSIFALQCGDPTGTGTGGPGYSFADENLPKDKLPAYHEGDVAMANTGQPASNGSQFFFLWQTSPLQSDYSLFGHVIEGLDVVKKVGTGGDDGAFAGEGQAGGGHPKTKFQFKTVTVGPVTETSVAKPTTAAASTAPATTAPASSAPATTAATSASPSTK